MLSKFNGTKNGPSERINADEDIIQALQDKELIDKCVRFLQSNNAEHKVEFTQDELDQGTLIHCMIVALIKLKYIEAEKKAIDEDIREDALEINLDKAHELRLHHQRVISDVNAFVKSLQQKMKELEQTMNPPLESSKRKLWDDDDYCQDQVNAFVQYLESSERKPQSKEVTLLLDEITSPIPRNKIRM